MVNAGGPPAQPGPATAEFGPPSVEPGPPGVAFPSPSVEAGLAGVAPGPGWAAYPNGAAGYPAPDPGRVASALTRLYARAPRWTAPLAALGCMAAAVGYTLLSNPTTSAPDAAPTCLLKLTTGLDCPGCGGTRAMWYLLHGDLPAAARHHVIWVFVLPFLLYLYLAWAVEQSFGWRLPKLRITPRLLGGVVAAWLAFSVARNLPWAPFTSLYV